MSWGEACRLVGELAKEMSSHTAVALGGWTHPWSWEANTAADLWDLTAGIHTAKGKYAPTYPRPWPAAVTARRRGNAGGRTPEQVKALLERLRRGEEDVPRD